MWLLACASPDLTFDGVASVRWDGGDGLVATWPAATGDDVAYELSVETLDGEPVDAFTLPDLTGIVQGLDDGEYRVRVEATDASGATAGGDVSLVQLVGENRLVYRGELGLEGAMDVWGEGDLVALAGGTHATTDVLLADISDPTAPATVATLEGWGQVRDVDVADGILYASSDCNCATTDAAYEAWDKVGARVVDVSDPASPALLAEIGPPTDSVHNLFYADGLLYLTSNFESAVVIYDVSDPAAPVRLSEWTPPDGSPHDQTVVGDTMWVAYTRGFARVDVSDPAAPVTLETWDPAGFHNIWPAGDDRHVLTTREVIGGPLEVWDLESGEEVAEVGMEASSCVHNVYVRDTTAYVAWYTDGVWVFDISDPTSPVARGWYDTWDGDGPPEGSDKPAIVGAWGVWPFGEHVVVGDTARGLLVLDWFPDVVTR
ncbi:MAG: hypothetical protein ACOZNI_13815 [Myxococcota bacterium]